MWTKKQKVTVTCVGSVSKDIFLPTGEGVFMETPEDDLAPHKVAFPLGGKVLIEDRYEDIGGVAANVTIGLRRLGITTRIVSRVGHDSIGGQVIERLTREKVSLDGLIQLPKTASDLSGILVFTQTGERTIFHNRDANEQLVVAPQDLEKTDWVFVSALNGDWKKNMQTILENKEQKDFHLAINPGQHNLKEDDDFMKTVIRQSTLMTLNHDEAIFLLGEHFAHLDEEVILKELVNLGPKYIGLTDGARGAWAYDGEKMYSMVPPKIEKVVDSTGGGDAFASGFFAAILHDQGLEKALRLGVANSVSVIKQYGATQGLLFEKDLHIL